MSISSVQGILLTNKKVKGEGNGLSSSSDFLRNQEGAIGLRPHLEEKL